MSQNPTAPDAPETKYWRSLEQLKDPASIDASHEFAEGASEPPVLDDLSRRKFFGIAAATAAVAGMTSCRKPVTHIVPFGQRPEDLVPGNPRYYATAHVENGVGTGILVKSSEGRPTKVEGNPLHPSSLGASDHLMQSELLNLYDPARSQHIVQKGVDPVDEHGHARHPTHADVYAAFNATVATDGTGLHILMEPTSSPSVHAALATLKAKFAKATVHNWAPIHRDAEYAGTRLAFGQALDTHYDLTKADVVVAVDCDFQNQDGDHVRTARDYASRRKLTSETEAGKLSRLYALESFHSVTGSNADHRFRLRPSEIGVAVAALAHELSAKHGVSVKGNYSAHAGAKVAQYNGKDWIPVLAADLAKKKGAAALVIGPRLPAEVQAACHAINDALGAHGSTVTFTTAKPGLDVDCGKSITALASAMGAGSVSTLLILGGNPVYTAPADLDFAAKLAKVKTKIHLSQFADETSALCDWHVPQAHDLETWGDIHAHDGTATLMQPLVAPLYGGLSTLEMLGFVTDGKTKGKGTKKYGAATVPTEYERGYDLVRATWKAKATGSFETFWSRALHDGVVPGTKAQVVATTLNGAAIGGGIKATAASLGSLEVQFRPDYNMHDGRYANNSWLQELPDPMTKLCWDNAVLMSLATANEAQLENGNLTDITVGGRSITAPVWVLPGHADHAITLTLGYGRDVSDAHHAAKDAGFDTYPVRTAANQHHASGGKLGASKGSYELVVTQEHGTMEGRALVRENDVAGYQKDPKFAPGMNPLAQMEQAAAETYNKKHEGHGHDYKPHQDPERPHSLWHDDALQEAGFDFSKGNQWGMVIDLNACTGCNACVSACVSENNIPMVGKEQVKAGREMFWNRIDRYFGNNTESNVESPGTAPKFNPVPEADNPMVVHQMVPCMQCENASCEVVCPVAATVHSPEGLNDMAYNRCIGTRYCGNNCPYKVRRFNYLDYHGDVAPQTKMVHNPDVTVRSRGVMEKCTYCVQRINRVKIDAKTEGRRPDSDGRVDIKDGEIATACEQSCPTQAITFGDINDKASRVAKLKASNLNYGMLAELNMRPRTTYLAKIRNPNPELVS